MPETMYGIETMNTDRYPSPVFKKSDGGDLLPEI